jgi:signal transduction histidine kinase/ActR/RegA family two-component response regulator
MLRPSDLETPKTTWFEGLLERAAQIDLLRFNLWMLFGIVVSSAFISLGLWSMAINWFGWNVPEGSGHLVFMIAASVSFAVGAPSVFLGYALFARIHSISAELRQALAAADLANRSKTEFLANMSHEVRTPLNGVLGMARMLEASTLDESQREALRVIQESGDVLMAVISEVLDLSKIDVGQVTLDPLTQPIVSILTSCVELFRARAVERGNKLSVFVDPGIPRTATYDSVRARQCLANLISNAVKFTRNGDIMVTLSSKPVEDGSIIEVRVKDTGIGIAEQDIPRLFQPFQQVGMGSPHMPGGTGLGLAISHRLARLLGGQLTVTSALGKGSEFCLSFRTETSESVGPGLTVVTPPGRSTDLVGIRALVVDDTPTNRIVVRSMLRALGADCLEAGDGVAALHMVQSEELDVILMDIWMPESNGFEVLQKIRALDRTLSSIPIIAVTADVVRETSDQYIARGFAGYLSKPIDLDDLSAVVRDAVSTGTSTSHRSRV